MTPLFTVSFMFFAYMDYVKLTGLAQLILATLAVLMSVTAAVGSLP